MSTSKNIDKICVCVIVIALIFTAVFMNGKSLGLVAVTDEDAESYEGTTYFTANDLDGDWDTSQATVITLEGSDASVLGSGAYAYDGSVYITNGAFFTARPVSISPLYISTAALNFAVSIVGLLFSSTTHAP